MLQWCPLWDIAQCFVTKTFLSDFFFPQRGRPDSSKYRTKNTSGHHDNTKLFRLVFSFLWPVAFGRRRSPLITAVCVMFQTQVLANMSAQASSGVTQDEELPPAIPARRDSLGNEKPRGCSIIIFRGRIINIEKKKRLFWKMIKRLIYLSKSGSITIDRNKDWSIFRF